MSRKKLVLYTLITFAIALTAGCGGETVVTKVKLDAPPGTQPNEGVLFSLPETVVMAEVPLTKVSSSPGQFSNWTPFFFPELTTDEFTTEEKTVFKVGLATFSTRGQTDPKNVYIAHIKAKQFETKTLLLEFNEDGIVARTDASSKDDTIDVVTSGIKTVASIVAPLIRGGAGIPFSGTSSNKAIDSFPDGGEAVAPEDLNCEEKLAKARQASQQATKATEKAEKSGKAADDNAARTARQAALALYAEYGACTENRFKKGLEPEDRALYESLDNDYKEFLRENFGYQFLTYLNKRTIPEGSTGIQFFFTLNKNQRDFIDKQKRGSTACEVWPSTTTMCLATEVKIELLKAKGAYDKILELRKKRQDVLLESTGNDVNTSAQLEFRLNELDAQIKSLEQTFFLGTSSETSGIAKFEFKPGDGKDIEPKQLFLYSSGGGKPGVCDVTKEFTGVFKALVPEQLKGDCHAPDYLVSIGDFHDAKKFIKRLKDHAAADRVSYYLYTERLTRPTKLLIDGSTDEDKPQVRAGLLNALIADLKTITEGSNIYDDSRFKDVDLSGATLGLQKKIAELEALPTPTAEQTASLAQFRIQLNRSLLDDAYPKELYRQSVWAAHTVSLSIDKVTPGLATTVDGQNLQEAGKRGFPYRIAAVAMAKMFDDKTEKGRSSLRIAQFGPVRSLPANLGGRRSSYKITYYDATGAIKVFDMSADALIQKSNVTDLTDAATTLRDSEAAKLKRDTELLELKKKKLDAEKALEKAAKEESSPSPSPEL